MKFITSLGSDSRFRRLGVDSALAESGAGGDEPIAFLHDDHLLNILNHPKIEHRK